jgi:hypothetical protein
VEGLSGRGHTTSATVSARRPQRVICGLLGGMRVDDDEIKRQANEVFERFEALREKEIAKLDADMEKHLGRFAAMIETPEGKAAMEAAATAAEAERERIRTADWRSAAERLMALRERLFVAIQHSFEECGNGKSYEGAFSIAFPNYFEARDPGPHAWMVHLDCYVVGPSRHYDWHGVTLEDAVAATEKDVNGWIEESEAGYALWKAEGGE